MKFYEYRFVLFVSFDIYQGSLTLELFVLGRRVEGKKGNIVTEISFAVFGLFFR